MAHGKRSARLRRPATNTCTRRWCTCTASTGWRCPDATHEVNTMGAALPTPGSGRIAAVLRSVRRYAPCTRTGGTPASAGEGLADEGASAAMAAWPHAAAMPKVLCARAPHVSRGASARSRGKWTCSNSHVWPIIPRCCCVDAARTRASGLWTVCEWCVSARRAARTLFHPSFRNLTWAVVQLKRDRLKIARTGM